MSTDRRARPNIDRGATTGARTAPPTTICLREGRASSWRCIDRARGVGLATPTSAAFLARCC